MRGGVDEQGHLAGTLDFAGQQTLMVRAGTGDAAGDDLAAFGDEVAQDVRALVVQGQILVRAEAAELATGGKLLLESHYATSTSSASLTVTNLKMPSVMRTLRSSSATSSAGAWYTRRT